MNETLQVLRKARDKISQGWVAHKRGEDEEGRYRNGADPEAVRWCALGAIDSAIGKDCVGMDFTAVHPAVSALAKELPGTGTVRDIAPFNNKHGQAAVLALFDRAIAKLSPKRTDAELVADLMARIGKQTIPDGEIASPEYARA